MKSKTYYLVCIFSSLLVNCLSLSTTKSPNQHAFRQNLSFKSTIVGATDLKSAPTRRHVLGTFVSSVFATSLVVPSSCNALVKGVAPPIARNKVGDKPKCSNIDECQALAEAREKAEREEAAQNQIPSSLTRSGTRYRDLVEGTGREAKDGDEVEILYKVLKLGKRSYDGLSGEGTVVFSRGFALEDDESVPGDKSFITTLGGYNNIDALNEAVEGMKVGGVRRFSILPQKGWRKAGTVCDGGPGGSGAGGELKTDYIVVPTATMVAEETCFDQTKLPFPRSYAQQRRMAQRFDQSLIMEVQLVAASPGQ